ncbi:MAG: crotonase/enoyl-CoA hydratase family protein [Pseudonocardiaceae bacterium]
MSAGQKRQQQRSLHRIGQPRQGTLQDVDQPLVLDAAADRVPVRLAQRRDRHVDQPEDVRAHGDRLFQGDHDLSDHDAENTSPPHFPAKSPFDPLVMARNHDPRRVWDPVTDYQMMLRNVRAFMSLFHSEKPVLCKVHGFCVAGGTDLALCADLLVVDDDAKIGYPPARVWGVPTSALWAARLGAARAKRLMFTGDCLSGREAYEWGLACESVPRDQLDERFEALVQRVARLPINQLVMQKILINQALFAQGLHATQVLGTFFDGIARHTPEGYAFQQRAAESGWREAVRLRDEPFGDVGSSTYKG